MGDTIKNSNKLNFPYIYINHVYKNFGDQKVLEDLSFSIQEGEILGLVGPNGSGKTTLIRLLNGIIAADSGEILIDGLDPINNGKQVRSICGTLTEEAGLYHEQTALQNLRFFSKLYGVDDENWISELLSKFGLEPYKQKKVGTFSAGMKKRLGLAKVLLHKPKILFLDEPTNGLDPEGIQLIIKSIEQLNQEYKTTVLICSHILSQLESICNRFVFVQYGKIIEQGNQKYLEKIYLKEFKLKVETDYRSDDHQIEGYYYKIISDEDILFTVPNKKVIAHLLEKLTAKAKVYSAEIINRDLESLYFEVKKKYHE